MKLKKIISSVLAFAMAISIVPVATYAAETVNTTLYSDDFESYALNTKPDNITIDGDADSVYVDDIGSSKQLWLKNSSDIKPIEIKKDFTQVSGKTVTFELDFLQLNTTSEGDTILGIYSGDTPVVLIETNGGNITYREGKTNYALVEGYGYNRVYSIKVELDLFNQSATVYVQDLPIDSYGLLDASGTVDNIRIKSQYSPGFAVDNIDVHMEENVNSVTVSGDTNPVIPAYDGVEYEYTATVTDSNGSVVAATEVEWSLTGSPENVSLVNPSGNKVKLLVKSISPEQTFGIRAKVKDSDISGTLTVTTKPLSASSIEIVGWTDKVEVTDNDGNKSSITYPSYRITGDAREPKTYKFKTKILDQFGNEVDNYGSFEWSLEPQVQNVSIDSRTGVVTVNGEPAEEQHITIKAVSRDNTSLVGQTTVSLLPSDIYAGDKARFDAVIAHIESALDSASIDGSPLIADMFMRSSRTPTYILTNTKDLMASNVMAQSNLLRAMYNLSVITGNSKYKDRVDEIYKYMMSTGLMDNGVAMGWGGHMTMDMETDTVFLDGNQLGTHEIKGITPFVAPMFSDTVNTGYTEDTFNNGNGWAGYLVRAMMGGHFIGNYETLAFERHWTDFNHANVMEPVWQHPELFDSERRGPIQREGGAAFTGAGANMMTVLLDYYEQTGDEYALAWAENFMKTTLNAGLTYYVYTDPNGNYIWPSDTDDDLKREYYNNQNQLVYKSVKTDSKVMYGVEGSNAIYEHRDIAEVDADGNITDIVKVVDNNGNEVELTLYNTWTEGLVNEIATTKGAEWQYGPLNESLETQYGEGFKWYDMADRQYYAGPEYGDRLYNNMVWGAEEGVDTWVTLGYISEEEGELMLDPYSGMRSFPACDGVSFVFNDIINIFIERGELDKAAGYLEQYSRGMYNDLKIRYNFSDDWLDSYMFWIRPDYMRANNIVDYVETPWDENIPEKNKRYLRTPASMGAPHHGYYYIKGDTFPTKRLELNYLGGIATTCASLRKVIELLEQTDPSRENYADNMELAATFRNRVKFLWKVMRDVCTDKVPIGDIGSDFFNLEADLALDMSTTANAYEMVENILRMYNATGHDDFLKLARRIANNYMEGNYNAGEQIFENGSSYFANSSLDILPIFLELDARLLGRFDENIKYFTSLRGAEFFDTSLFAKDGYYDYNNTYLGTPSTLYPDDSVMVKKVNILHDVIELNVGESIKVQYEVLPWDAGSKGVLWDVYDQRVAMMDTDTATLYGLKKGKTKIRCVSSSRTGIESKEVEVIVK